MISSITSRRFSKGRWTLPAALVASVALSGCTVVGVAASAVDVATDVVVTAVDLTTDAVVTGVELATSGGGEEESAAPRMIEPPAPANGAAQPPAPQSAAPLAVTRIPETAPRHGNFCGGARSGRERVAIVDRIDGFCRDHAVCKTEGVAPADCDAVLVRRLAQVRDRLPADQQGIADSLLVYYRR